MSDLRRRERVIGFEGGVITDAPSVLRPVDDTVNLIPRQGFKKNPSPRAGIEPVIKVVSTESPHEGVGIFEVTLDDCARQKILCLMDKATGEIRHITKHTDQEGRISIPPEGGGTLPITPEPEHDFANTLYFAESTAQATPGETLTLTVMGTNDGGKATVRIDLITAEDGVDVIEDSWTVTANETSSGTVAITIPDGAREGRMFDVYLVDPEEV